MMLETRVIETIDHFRRGFGSSDATVIDALQAIGAKTVFIIDDSYFVFWEGEDGRPLFVLYCPNERLFPDRELVHGEGVHC